MFLLSNFDSKSTFLYRYILPSSTTTINYPTLLPTCSNDPRVEGHEAYPDHGLGQRAPVSPPPVDRVGEDLRGGDVGLPLPASHHQVHLKLVGGDVST